jgi:hypothetical protein
MARAARAERAKAEAKGRAAKSRAAKSRKAAESSVDAAQAAVALKAAELLERVREADPLGRLSAAGSDAVQRVQAGSEQADQAAERQRATSPDERLPELIALLREAQQARRADVPGKKRRRRPPLLLILLLAAGAAAAWWRRSQAQSEDDPYAQSAEWLAAAPEAAEEPRVEEPSGPAPSGVPSVAPDSSTTLSTADELTVDIDMPVVTGPVATEPVVPGGAPLAEDIRSELDSDPRTAGLIDLAINVSDRTVFVRGNVPAGFDPTAIRDVIAAVPGVTDVDMQVTYT